VERHPPGQLRAGGGDCRFRCGTRRNRQSRQFRPCTSASAQYVAKSRSAGSAGGVVAAGSVAASRSSAADFAAHTAS